MKRLVLIGLLASAVLSAGTSAFAQAIAKGKNELSTDISFTTAKLTGDLYEVIGGDVRIDVDAERQTQADWTVSYARFLTDRFAAGPLFRISKSSGGDATGYLGARGIYHFGDLTRWAVPVVEINSSRTFNDAFANFTDLQLLAGVMIPMGSTGGRFRITPYYYKAFYDDEVSSKFQSFGISWSVALLF